MDIQDRDACPDGGETTFSEALEAVVELASRQVEREQAGQFPVKKSAGELYEELDLALGRDGCSFEELVTRLRGVMAATPSPASPRFVNQLFGGRIPVATMAEMLTAVMNTSMYTYKVAGPQVLIEHEALSRMRRFVGFEDGEGAFCPGGSLCNFTAMLLARNRAIPQAREEGVCDGQRLGVYASAECHYSIAKSAGMLGLGRRAFRAIATDQEGRMSVPELQKTMDRDLAEGVRPAMIVATAGTTVRGAFDPIRELAGLAGKYDLWMHVDGAFGASVLMSEIHRKLADGIVLADSVAWNPHKMIGTPLSCSAILLRQRGLLAESLSEEAGYLFQTDEDALNPGIRSIQCGRRNDALKLWAAWKYYGDQGLGQRIDRLFELARTFAGMVEQDPDLELVQTPPSINVCFRVRGRSSSQICDRLDREGRLKIGFGVVGGQEAIRMVCVNPLLGDADLQYVLDQVKA